MCDLGSAAVSRLPSGVITSSASQSEFAATNAVRRGMLKRQVMRVKRLFAKQANLQ